MRCEPVRSSAFGAIVAGYSAVGTGLVNPCRILLIQNLTDATVMISVDGGATDSFPIVSNGYIVLDFTTNKSQAAGCFLVTGTVISVKRIGVPSVGSVYVSSFFGSAT